jgi:uncharacterized protein YndB with AHSA1/START domain
MDATTSTSLAVQVSEHAFQFSRIINAPRSLVYQVWTNPAHFKLWWGPHTFTTECEMDARVGGRYSATMISPEGERNPLKGEFLELIPNEKIVMTMVTQGHTSEWHAIVNQARGLAADAPSANPLATITFEDFEGKTKITIKQEFVNNVDRDAFLKLGSVIGWGQSFVKMDSLLATLASEDEFYHFRTVNAPAALVWKAWSNVEHVAKWWGPNGFTNTFTKFDLRTGGLWLYTMHGPDGTDYPNWMGFEEVIPQQRIAYRHGEFQDDPNAFFGEISFSEVEGNRTQIILRLRLASREARDGMFQYGVFEGGDQTLSRLEAFVQTV